MPVTRHPTNQLVAAFPPVSRLPVGFYYVDNEFRPIEMDTVAQIMRHWFGPHLPGIIPAAWSRFPNRYTVLDLESSGVNTSMDLIVAVGWAVVEHQRVIESGNLILNWFEDPRINPCWLSDRLQRVQEHMQAKQQPWHYPAERLQQEGVPPGEALSGLAQLLYDGLMTGHLFVGHNFCHFDTRLINSNLYRFLNGYKLPWEYGHLFDTGLVEKAAQQGRLPWLGETLTGWHRRASHPPFNVNWSLSDHCCHKYRLVERYGIDVQQAHTAAADCVTCHHLYETFRQLAEGTYCDVPLQVNYG